MITGVMLASIIVAIESCLYVAFDVGLSPACADSRLHAWYIAWLWQSRHGRRIFYLATLVCCGRIVAHRMIFGFYHNSAAIHVMTIKQLVTSATEGQRWSCILSVILLHGKVDWMIDVFDIRTSRSHVSCL